MIRALLRTVLIVIVLVAVAAFFLGYRLNGTRVVGPADRPVGTSGTAPKIDTERAREAGAAIGEKVAAGANEAERVLTDAGRTAKIKSKMALDDTVKARTIDVTTSNGIVTLTGTVGSEAERAKAVQLAKETQGVTLVVDHLRVR
jgi:hyperosmotically inducible protein